MAETTKESPEEETLKRPLGILPVFSGYCLTPAVWSNARSSRLWLHTSGLLQKHWLAITGSVPMHKSVNCPDRSMTIHNGHHRIDQGIHQDRIADSGRGGEKNFPSVF